MNSIPKCMCGNLIFDLVTLNGDKTYFALSLVQVIKSLNSRQSVQTEWVGDGKPFLSNVGRYKVNGELPNFKVSNAFLSFLCYCLLFQVL